MRAMKVFIKTCYSEGLLAAAGESLNEKNEQGGDETAGALSKDDEEPSYHGGLGLKYKFPGDPKKCVYLLEHIIILNLIACQTARSVQDQAVDYVSKRCMGFLYPLLIYL